MVYATRRERIEAEKQQRRGRHMRSLKVGVASFATFAGVSVAGIAPAHADYTVERGDTLYGIAAKHDNVTVSGLMQANGLSSSLIYPGQNLKFSKNASSSNSNSSSGSSSSTSSTSRGTYTVISGDTLSRIAAKHGTTVSALMSKNNLSSTLIYPGNRLTIPGSGSSSASSSSNSSSSSSNSSTSNRSASTPSSGKHSVVAGDTLGRIAARYGTSVSALMSANNLSSTVIYVGNQLTIPGASGSTSSSSNSTSSDSSNSERVSKTTTASAPSTSGASWAANAANSGAATYRLGANGQGGQYDCSSFTQTALAKDGKSIPRTSAAQYASAKKISKSQLQAGDLVFFGSGRVTHVAVYVGNGQIAHARNKSAGVTVNSLDTYSKWSNVIGYGRY